MADQKLLWLEQQLERSAAEQTPVRERIVIRIDRLHFAVADADAASEVDVLESNAFRRKPVDQGKHFCRRLEMRIESLDLRADMHVDSPHFDVGEPGGVAVKRQRVVERDAELGFLESGRDVGMRSG